MQLSISSLKHFPPLLKLQNLCKSLAVLDAVLAEEWESRYYSYNRNWAAGEEFFGMRDGCGDSLQILFQEGGCVVNGMMHEYPQPHKPAITTGLPARYRNFMFGEPVDSTGTTFCMWTDAQDKWQTGAPENASDSSADLLSVFDGDAKTYIQFATDYYEDTFTPTEKAKSVVNAIYKGEMLTSEMILALNEAFEHWEQLQQDLMEIGYKTAF